MLGSMVPGAEWCIHFTTHRRDIDDRTRTFGPHIWQYFLREAAQAKQVHFKLVACIIYAYILYRTIQAKTCIVYQHIYISLFCYDLIYGGLYTFFFGNVQRQGMTTCSYQVLHLFCAACSTVYYVAFLCQLQGGL